jgi:hypothetical protein
VLEQRSGKVLQLLSIPNDFVFDRLLCVGAHFSRSADSEITLNTIGRRWREFASRPPSFAAGSVRRAGERVRAAS